jgi:hypothetical protein
MAKAIANKFCAEKADDREVAASIWREGIAMAEPMMVCGRENFHRTTWKGTFSADSPPCTISAFAEEERFFFEDDAVMNKTDSFDDAPVADGYLVGSESVWLERAKAG